MRNNKTIIVLILLTSIFINAKAQLSTHEKPVSFTREKELPYNFRSMVPIVTMPQLDMDKIAKEDEEDERYDMPPRFGYSHFVDYDLNNSGRWFELPNGDRLWQLEVVCPDALSVNFCYDKFWLPDGGKFFVYSKDKKQILGAFTSRNNKGDRENMRGFATGLIYGDDVVLEYYQPKGTTSDVIISMKKVVHGYRYIINELGFGASGSCVVNVNCEEGKNWQNEKKAIARIILDGERFCSGSLIVSTNLSMEPFFLTANHCIDVIGKDAVSNPVLDNTLFYWNYEAPGCININNEPSSCITHDATVLANDTCSDFALLRLSEDPINLTNYTPYYLSPLV